MILYHGVRSDKLASIRKRGLRPRRGFWPEHSEEELDAIKLGVEPGIYLTTSPAYASQFGDVILEVRVPPGVEIFEVFEPDAKDYNARTFSATGPIPPAYIRLYSRNPNW